MSRDGASMTDHIEAPHDPASDRRTDTGPFDIIGDVHGCTDELIDLLEKLGYRVRIERSYEVDAIDVDAPSGRRVVFVGDLADRGPRSADALALAMNMVARGQALCVPGNHDWRLMRWLQGRNVKMLHGLDLTIGELTGAPDHFRDNIRTFIETLPVHLWLDGGRLAVAHAGIQPPMLGRMSGRIREFCLYGDTDGTDADGLPIRYHWAAHYDGESSVIYGHTPIGETGWVNRTLCIDTGCCFGGALTALRWPEMEVVQVKARREYARLRRPFGHPPVRSK